MDVPEIRFGAEPLTQMTTNNNLGAHVKATLKLAFPVMLARAGILVLIAVDTAMTGHAGAVELAYYALATAPQVPMLLVGIGLLMGTMVLTAQAEGAHRPTECGAVWRVALLHAAVCGALFIALSQAGEWFLSHTGQSPDLAHGAGRVLIVFGWGLPGMLLYTATTFFLEAIYRPTPGMVVILIANALNVGLNWVFIYGNLGMPAMGAEGAALATTLVRWFMFIALAGYVLAHIDRRHYGLTRPFQQRTGLGRKLRRIGYPMGLSHGLEASAFSAMMLFAGLIGAVQVAAYQVAMNLAGLVFMCSLGFATAASVRVGSAAGRQDPQGMKRSGWVAVGLAVALLSAFGLSFHDLPDVLAAVYTSDAIVLATLVPTITIVAFVLVPDGTQAVLMGALRSTGDVWPATALYLISFWFVMVPLGYALGVRGGGGAQSLMMAVVFGCVFATVSLGVRFHVVSRRAVIKMRTGSP